jgi:16S rRNA pseudouridine516 synthase
MRLAQILFSQGFGNRRECAALVRCGAVQVAGRVVADPEAELATDALVFSVHGQPWPYHARAVLMLHKPAGYECSRAPQHHASVMSLLPPPLRRRGVQPVGRLDADTTGLLLLTDDGALSHRLSGPRHHVAKVYEVTTRHAVDARQVAALLQGVALRDDATPACASACEVTGSNALRLTLTEGRYHQVKRMLAAVGNRVEALHRSALGPLQLPADLAPGAWRWLGEADCAALSAPTAGAAPGARG